MNEYNLTLDLAKAKQRQQQTVFVRQGDKNATTIVATITDHGAAAATSGLTARFSMRLPDGTHYYRKAASLSGNVATVALDEAQAASAVGRTDTAYFQLLQGSTVVASTESFTIVVLPDALADAEVAESYDSAIQDAIDALDAAVEQMPDMVEDVLEAHPEWTTTVQDGSITKAKLATDLARDRERLLYRLANMLTNTLPEGDVATASDAAQTPMAALALYGRSTQDGTPTPSTPVPIVSVMGQLYSWQGMPNRTTSGITWTINADGSIHAKGTATGISYGVGISATTQGSPNRPLLPAGTYTASSPDGATFDVEVMPVGGTNAQVRGFGTAPVTFTLSEPSYVFLGVRVASGAVVDADYHIALYAGTTAYPYVPYDHVGLWARGRNLWSLGQEYSRTSAGDLFARSAMHVPAGQYTLSFDVVSFTSGSNNNVQLLMYDQSVTVVTQPSVALRTGRVSLAVNPSRDVESLKIYVGTACTLANFQLERGSTVHAYQPYTSTVTPLPLDGHELRSLPDGTRDELTVDERGHAVLVQRVGSVDLGTLTWTPISSSDTSKMRMDSRGVRSSISPTPNSVVPNVMCERYQPKKNSDVYQLVTGVNIARDGDIVIYDPDYNTNDSASAFAAAVSGVALIYPLATPVTHDLGTVDPVPLVGPDLTAQAVPTAPMQLTYERDLNTTLARLESAIATLA